MESPRPSSGAWWIWAELLLVVVATVVVYAVLGTHHTPAEPESPETDGESIDAFFHVVGTAATFVASVVLVTCFELTRRFVGRYRRISRIVGR